MKELNLTLPRGSLPKYLRLADALRGAIRGGQLRPGELLPSSRQLAHRLGFNRHTIMNAIAELEAEGWISAHEKKHYLVTATLPSTFLQAKSPIASKSKFKEVSYRFRRRLEIEDYSNKDGFKHAFASGSPDTRLFPVREFKSHFYDALKSKKILSYGDPVGYAPLLSQITTYLRRVRNIEDREVIITNGSQEAIFLLAQLLVGPGDAVAVEAMGYPPAMEALKFAGARLIPIGVDPEGLRVDELEKRIKSRKIKLIYLTPLHQYPTTVTLSASRRLQLYELAYKNGILILEDDYDHEFHYISQPIAPLASFDPGKIVSYVSTFSKILFPSARLGFMAVSPRMAREVAKLKRVSSRQNEQLLQGAIANWMRSGGFERHLRKMRRAYEDRRNGMLSTLEEIQQDHKEISWTKPDGGMALWMNIGVDSKRFAEKARRKGIFVNAEGNYRMDGQAGTHLRLGFSGQTVEENRSGLRALAALL